MADVPKAERLVNLVIALLETRKPLTLAEIKRRTGYYEGNEQSARRKFERDKDELRQLGVPIETRPSDLISEAADGYIIDRASYEQPDVKLDDDEAAALAIVVRMTAEQDARLAFNRIAATSPDDVMADPALALGSRLALGEGPYEELADAVVARRPVAFDYRRADGVAERRDVHPYALLSRGGQWYLVGHDLGREAQRAYRLDRIVGTVEVAGDVGAFEVPDDLDPVAAVRGPSIPADDLRVAVAPELGWDAQALGGRPTGEQQAGLEVHEFAHADRHRLASWVVGNAGRAVALAPPELVEDVVGRLRAVHAALAGGTR